MAVTITSVATRLFLRRLYGEIYEENKETPSAQRITEIYEKGKTNVTSLALMERESYNMVSSLDPASRKCVCWCKGCCFPLYGLYWLICIPSAACCNVTWGINLDAGCCDYPGAECRALKRDKQEFCCS